MNWRTLIGYIVSALVAPVAGYFVGKHAGPELGATVAAGVGGVGARVLHLQDPPTAKAP